MNTFDLIANLSEDKYYGVSIHKYINNTSLMEEVFKNNKML